MEFNAQSPYVNMGLKMSHEGEFKLPPPGIHETRYSIAGTRYVKYSVRCDVEGCWFSEGTLPTREGAEKFLADHKAGGKFVRPCPAPPRRESLPSGLRYVEKLWRELDDVIECISLGGTYREGTKEAMEGPALAGYAKGLAFSIVMLDGIYFPDMVSVARHARDRRLMRIGEIPYVATPSTRKHDATIMEVNGLHVAEDQAKPAAAAPAKTKAPAMPSEQIQSAIRAGIKSGMMSASDMAEAYNLPVDLIIKIAG